MLSLEPRPPIRPLARRVALALCFGIPVLILAASFFWLALDHGTARLWGVLVHESGRYTLGETILYFSHFLREVPTAIAYVLFLLGSSGAVGQGTSRQGGLAGTLAEPVVGRAALVAAGALVVGAPVLGLHRRWAAAALAYFLVLSQVFGLSADVFGEVRYAGRQAREILTHGPVTLLLGLGILMAASGTLAVARSRTMVPPVWLALAWGALAVVIPIYLAAVSLGGDVMEPGQAEFGLAAMVAAHYFEHVLDHFRVSLLLLGGLARVNLRSSPAARNSGTSRDNRSQARP